MGPPTPVKVQRTGLFLGLFVIITVKPRGTQKMRCKVLQDIITVQMQILFYRVWLGEQVTAWTSRDYDVLRLSLTCFLSLKATSLLHNALMYCGLFLRCSLQSLSVFACLKETLNIVSVSNLCHKLLVCTEHVKYIPMDISEL